MEGLSGGECIGCVLKEEGMYVDGDWGQTLAFQAICALSSSRFPLINIQDCIGILNYENKV